MDGYVRERKAEKPILAICYDFDKTLTPTDMQAQGLIQKLDIDVREFWKRSNSEAENNNMDINLSWMKNILNLADGKIVRNHNTFVEMGKSIKLFNGVESWFERINRYGEEHGLIVEHYIISSGLKEMIEGTSICNNFKAIYASSYYYENDVPKWVAQDINSTNKTQFLFRIEKGVLNINSDELNERFSDEELRVPFSNMVYIGDSATDIPCMKLVHGRGGYSIGVYDEEENNKDKVYNMVRDCRIDFFAPANYSENSQLELYLKTIIEKVATTEKLNSFSKRCKDEVVLVDQGKEEYVIRIDTLIILLDESPNFYSTHRIIGALAENFDYITDEQAEKIVHIALRNNQVYYILRDSDISEFLIKILQEKKFGENSHKDELLKLMKDDYKMV